MGEEQILNHNEFLDLLPEIVFEIDEDLKINFLNNSCEQILGYRKNELLNNIISIEDFVAPKDLGKIKRNFIKNFKGQHITGNDYSVYSKSGKEVTLEFYNSHIKKDGKVIGLRCIAIDITEKEKTRKQLQIQEKHYRHIFQNFPLPYQSLNSEGIVIDINPVWEELMGYTRDEIVGRSFTYLLSDDNRDKFYQEFKLLKSKGVASNVPFELIRKDGSTIYVDFNGKIEYSVDNQFVRSHCVFNDTTMQKKAENTLIKSEERLRELNATKDKFFSIIAHDLKNPFNDLMGFTQLLALNIDKYSKSKIEQFIHIIHQSSKLAYNLLENLLDWSRTQTGTLRYTPEKILINTLVDENIDLLESTSRNKNIQIISKIENPIHAFADKNMIRTVIRNLISNGIKYTNNGGTIHLKSSDKNNICEISITDTGIGISKENVTKIFKLDESFSTIGTDKEKGTGLGLILCKEFVEKNGGELKVESKPGKGSTFSFTLPLANNKS